MQSKDAIQKYLNEVGGDGWTIFKPEYLVGLGFEEKFVKKFTYKEKSGKGKFQLYDQQGSPVPFIIGVYALTFIYGIAEDVGADMTGAHSKNGRGFQAQELVIAIDKVLNPVEITA